MKHDTVRQLIILARASTNEEISLRELVIACLWLIAKHSESAHWLIECGGVEYLIQCLNSQFGRMKQLAGVTLWTLCETLPESEVDRRIFDLGGIPSLVQTAQNASLPPGPRCAAFSFLQMLASSAERRAEISIAMRKSTSKTKENTETDPQQIENNSNSSESDEEVSRNGRSNSVSKSKKSFINDPDDSVKETTQGYLPVLEMLGMQLLRSAIRSNDEPLQYYSCMALARLAIDSRSKQAMSTLGAISLLLRIASSQLRPSSLFERAQKQAQVNDKQHWKKRKERPKKHVGHHGEHKSATESKENRENVSRIAQMLNQVDDLSTYSEEEEEEEIDDVESAALRALLNLSTLSENQLIIARKGLYELLDIARVSINKQHRNLSGLILQNLAMNPKNRTLLYRAELRVHAIEGRVEALYSTGNSAPVSCTTDIKQEELSTPEATDDTNSLHVTKPSLPKQRPKTTPNSPRTARIRNSTHPTRLLTPHSARSPIVKLDKSIMSDQTRHLDAMFVPVSPARSPTWEQTFGCVSSAPIPPRPQENCKSRFLQWYEDQFVIQRNQDVNASHETSTDTKLAHNNLFKKTADKKINFVASQVSEHAQTIGQEHLRPGSPTELLFSSRPTGPRGNPNFIEQFPTLRHLPPEKLYYQFDTQLPAPLTSVELPIGLPTFNSMMKRRMCSIWTPDGEAQRAAEFVGTQPFSPQQNKTNQVDQHTSRNRTKSLNPDTLQVLESNQFAINGENIAHTSQHEETKQSIPQLNFSSIKKDNQRFGASPRWSPMVAECSSLPMDHTFRQSSLKFKTTDQNEGVLRSGYDTSPKNVRKNKQDDTESQDEYDEQNEGFSSIRRTPRGPIKLVLDPQTRTNTFVFNAREQPLIAIHEKPVTLAQFLHAPGCQVCKDLYQHYQLPDGTIAHFYHKKRIFELNAGQEHPPDPPYRLGDMMGSSLPAFPFPPLPPLTLPPDASPDAIESPNSWKHVLNVIPHECNGLECQFFGMIPDQRLLLHVKEGCLDSTEPRRFVERLNGGCLLSESVFAPRAIESTSGSFWDDESTYHRAFLYDWDSFPTNIASFLATCAQSKVERLQSKRGSDLVSIELARAIAFQAPSNIDPHFSELDLAEALFKQALWRRYRDLVHVFSYFSAIGASANKEVFCLKATEFVELFKTCSTNSGNNPYCSPEVLESIFHQVTGNSKASNRTQFLHIIIRIIAGVYYIGGDFRSTSEAVDSFFQHIFGSIPPLAMMDPNNFRCERLYSTAINELIVSQMPRITTLYIKCCTMIGQTTGQQRASSAEFNTLLADADMFDDDFTERDARLCFAWSRSFTIEPLKNVQVDVVPLEESRAPVTNKSANKDANTRDYTSQQMSNQTRRSSMVDDLLTVAGPLFEPPNTTIEDITQVGLTLTEFIEALARVADRKSLPTQEEIDEAGVKNVLELIGKKKRRNRGPGRNSVFFFLIMSLTSFVKCKSY